MVYFLSFVIIFVVILFMAIGVGLANKPLLGSCGGLACRLCRGKKAAKKMTNTLRSCPYKHQT